MGRLDQLNNADNNGIGEELNDILKSGRKLKEPEQPTDPVKVEEDESPLDFIADIYQKPTTIDKRSKNLYLSFDNIKWIEKESKKAQKTDSKFIDELLTKIRELKKK